MLYVQHSLNSWASSMLDGHTFIKSMIFRNAVYATFCKILGFRNVV